jgi:hypothetical protein
MCSVVDWRASHGLLRKPLPVIDEWGRKEIIGLADGYRESTQSWRELLLDLQRRGLTFGPFEGSSNGVDIHRWRYGSASAAYVEKMLMQKLMPETVVILFNLVTHKKADASKATHNAE